MKQCLCVIGSLVFFFIIILSCVLQGRNPFFLEPAIILAITDGTKLTSSSGVQDEVGHMSVWAGLEGS